jgi:hypothetical protein
MVQHTEKKGHQIFPIIYQIKVGKDFSNSYLKQDIPLQLLIHSTVQYFGSGIHMQKTKK